jgi:hypothetical protein
MGRPSWVHGRFKCEKMKGVPTFRASNFCHLNDFYFSFSFFQARKRKKSTKINYQILFIKTVSFSPMGFNFQLSNEKEKGCGMVFAGVVKITPHRLLDFDPTFVPNF